MRHKIFVVHGTMRDAIFAQRIRQQMITAS